MASLKVKRLKQETVGNKQEEAKPTWGRSPSSPSRSATQGRLGEGLPPLGRPPPPIKGGAGPPPLDTQVS
jgi:hypothetical protein